MLPLRRGEKREGYFPASRGVLTRRSRGTLLTHKDNGGVQKEGDKEGKNRRFSLRKKQLKGVLGRGEGAVRRS